MFQVSKKITEAIFIEKKTLFLKNSSKTPPLLFLAKAVPKSTNCPSPPFHAIPPIYWFFEVFHPSTYLIF